MMDKVLLAAIALGLSAAAPAHAQDAEINYPEGSLGFAALMQADYEAAEAQLLKAEGVGRNDAARLINLGQVYAATGRHAEAEVLLKRAAKAKKEYLVLADGSVVDSRDAAKTALAQLEAKSQD